MEYFRETTELGSLLERFVTEAFLREVCEKYHYEETAVPELKAVARRMRQSMYREAAFAQAPEKRGRSDRAAVVMTLGEGVDLFQDACTAEGRFSECYMIEALGSELLLQGYAAFNRLAGRRGAGHVARYYFLGSDPEYPLEELPELLRTAGLSVTCTEGFCMRPRKSVAFYVRFTEDESVRCEGICVGCGSESCPNRIEAGRRAGESDTDMTDRPLTYGYARILGRRYQ